jgi:hypothetical protein
VSISENVGIDPKGDAGICMPQLSLNDLRSCARVEKQASVRVSEGMEPTAGNGQEIKNRPKPILHDFV